MTRLLAFAPDGIGDVGPGDDLAALLHQALTAHPDGPLRDGDVLVVTSKVVSKAEGRSVAADDRDPVVDAETVRTVARRGTVRIVENRQGLVQAAAGVDSSNVAPGTALLLPVDPDVSARRLRERLQQLSGVRLGVVVSDTSGRAWRRGQIDLAVGVAGVLPTLDYGGRTDPWGNDLVVTQMAVADEIASAGDLVKAKLGRRPVAVLRGLAELVVDDAPGARSLTRTGPGDMFGRGTREAVLHAALSALGAPGRYEELVALQGEALTDAVVALAADESQAVFVSDLLDAARHSEPPPP